MRRSDRLRVATRWSSLALVMLASFIAGAVTLSVVTSPQPISVPIHVAYTPDNIPFPVVTVRLSNGNQLKMALDTGSSGVEIYAASLSSTSGLQQTTTPLQMSFEDGTEMDGTVAYANLVFDGASTGEMPVELVNTIGCLQGSACLEGSGATAKGAYKTNGILGISANPDSGTVPNPIPRMPGIYGSQWSVTIGLAGIGGTLVLGASTPSSLITSVDMRQVSGSDGQFGWDDEIRACWQVGRAASWCEPTAFDTGSSSSRERRTSVDFPVSLIPDSTWRYAQPFLPVSVDVQGKQLVRYVTQDDLSTTLLVVPSKSPSGSLGVVQLSGLTLTYDNEDGRLLFSRS